MTVHADIESPASETAQKAVTRPSDSAIYTVGYLWGEAACIDGPLLGANAAGEPCFGFYEDARKRAALFLGLFTRAEASGLVHDWRHVFVLWQHGLDSVPRNRPLLTNLTATHHWLADLLERQRDPFDAFNVIFLPCRLCGCIFESRRAATDGRYRRNHRERECRRTVGERLTGRDDANGRGLQVAAIDYPNFDPDGPKRFRASVVESVRCAEDGCSERFTRTNPTRRYCDRHNTQTAKVRRSRAKPRPPM